MIFSKHILIFDATDGENGEFWGIWVQPRDFTISKTKYGNRLERLKISAYGSWHKQVIDLPIHRLDTVNYWKYSAPRRDVERLTIAEIFDLEPDSIGSHEPHVERIQVKRHERDSGALFVLHHPNLSVCGISAGLGGCDGALNADSLVYHLARLKFHDSRLFRQRLKGSLSDERCFCRGFRRILCLFFHSVGLGMNVTASLAQQNGLPNHRHNLQRADNRQNTCKPFESPLYCEILSALLASLIAGRGGWLTGGGHRI